MEKCPELLLWKIVIEYNSMTAFLEHCMKVMISKLNEIIVKYLIQNSPELQSVG